MAFIESVSKSLSIHLDADEDTEIPGYMWCGDILRSNALIDLQN